MNYALNFTGAGHVTVPTLTGGGAAGRICRADIEISNYTTQSIMGNNLSGSGSSIRILSATSLQVRVGELSARTITLAANSIPLNTRLVLEVFKTSTPTLEVRVNGAVVGSTAISGAGGELTTNFVVNYIGIAASTTGRFVGKMYELDLFGNTFLNTDQPTATTWGAGTLVGFPTDGTQWTAYGGGTPPTGTVTIGTITPSSTGASVPFTYSAADQTGFEYQLNETGTIYPISASPATPTGLTSATPYTIRTRAVNASGSGAWSASAPFTTTAATTAISFSGTIPAQVFTNGQAVSVDLSGYFTGTLTPFTFANTGAPLTGTGLSISSAGVLNGTATTGSVTGVTVTGTDTASNTAVSNAFNVTVNPASVPVSFGGTIPAITGTQNAAITPVNTSTYFSGNLTPFTYSLFSGTLPAGVTLNSSTGVISGTPTVSFSGNIVVRATDTGSNTANSNSIAVTIAAPVGTLTITDVANNIDAPWTSVAVDAATVMPLSLGSVVVNKTGLSTTAGADLVITDTAIVTGTEYIIILKIGTAYGWYRAVAT